MTKALETARHMGYLEEAARHAQGLLQKATFNNWEQPSKGMSAQGWVYGKTKEDMRLATCPCPTLHAHTRPLQALST